MNLIENLLNWISKLILNKVKLPRYIKNIHFEILHDGKQWLSAPKEAEEITKLAEGGESDAKIKKLIKKFLENQIGIGEKNDK